METLPLLEFEGVSKSYQPRTGLAAFWSSSSRKAENLNALSEVSLAIDKGEAVGLVGESGAGKSTLAAIAAGLTDPTSGTVRISGIEESGSRREIRRRRARTIQLIWQDAVGSLNPRMKVGKAVAEPLQIHHLAVGQALDDEVNRLLSEVDLKPELAKRYPHEISGGEAQRVVIARALALNPKLLICDEPASALDARLKVQIAELLMRLKRERGLALLIIAHDLALVGRMTKRLYVMYQGRIVESGPTVQVLTSPLHPYTRLLVSSDPSMPGWGEALVSTLSAAHGNPLEGCRLNGIGGAGPSKEACCFAPKCTEQIATCRQVKPSLTKVGEERWVGCLLKTKGLSQ
jgi:peptide/nickel transport system ATP-binding protein